MRYVDIDELEFPSDWESKADKALTDLRKEIENAELAAQLSGKDVELARKEAIKQGLDKKSRKNIWKDLSENLGKLTGYKCWYSESRNSGSDKDVDHFRPKGSVAEDQTHEGYWWLAFEWKNYRYSCKWCNQRRVDTVHNTDGGKWDHFPLGEGSFRAKTEADDYEDEDDIDLLDPTHPNEWRLLTFRPDGYPIPTQAEGVREHDRAKASIFFYHLDRHEFVIDRRELCKQIRRIIERMEIHRIQFVNPSSQKLKQLYLEDQKELLRLINKRKAAYSAAALAYAQAESSKTGREWLREVLEAHN